MDWNVSVCGDDGKGGDIYHRELKRYCSLATEEHTEEVEGL